MHTKAFSQAYWLSGTLALPLRLVVGWTYFSALWRRVALANKLDPDTAGYIGVKFNHFLPNALGIQPLIEFMLENPDVLWVAMVVFTIVEGIVGLCLMLGLFTRVMSLGVIGLAMGILLGAGWIGTTCLDEWQIGVLGVSAGMVLWVSGSGRYSLDQLLLDSPKWELPSWFPWLGSGALPLSKAVFGKVALGAGIFALGLTLFTNQHFHGGLWGPLHNKSVRPKLEVSETRLQKERLSFEVFRVEGVDVYGSFLIGLELYAPSGERLLHLDGSALSELDPASIENDYVAEVRPGKHSLVLPLGARATISLEHSALSGLPAGDYRLVLTDISGIEWEAGVQKE